MTDELVAFLKDCLDEDEQVAQALDGSRWYVYEDGQVVEWDGETWADGSARLPNRHQGSWLALDPARVLAEVAAKRRIINRYEASEEAAGTRTLDEQWLDVAQGRRDALLQAVRDLASVYAGRPGWREEWAADEEVSP